MSLSTTRTPKFCSRDSYELYSEEGELLRYDPFTKAKLDGHYEVRFCGNGGHDVWRRFRGETTWTKTR